MYKMNMFPYEKEVAPEEVNMDPSKVAEMAGLFEKQQRRGDFPGGQLAVRRKGKLVLNRACGIARGFRSDEGVEPIDVETNSYFPANSCGKPIAAIAIAVLEERNRLDINAPISDILPEFAKHPSRKITLLDVLTHRAGLVLPGLQSMYDQWDDEEKIWQYILTTNPLHKPGTFAYMPSEFGWILSQVVKRIDGRSIIQFIHDEIATPLQLTSLRFGLDRRDKEEFVYNYWQGKDKMIIAGNNVAPTFEAMLNSNASYNSPNPAFNIVTDAASLAAFYEFLVNKGLSHTGVRLLKEESFLKYTQKKVLGWNISIRSFISMGCGFMLGMRFMPSLFGWYGTQSCFGHGGAFSSCAFGDFDTGISVAILTNGNRDHWDAAKRLIPLSHGLRKACR